MNISPTYSYAGEQGELTPEPSPPLPQISYTLSEHVAFSPETKGSLDEFIKRYLCGETREDEFISGTSPEAECQEDELYCDEEYDDEALQHNIAVANEISYQEQYDSYQKEEANKALEFIQRQTACIEEKSRTGMLTLDESIQLRNYHEHHENLKANANETNTVLFFLKDINKSL